MTTFSHLQAPSTSTFKHLHTFNHPPPYRKGAVKVKAEGEGLVEEQE